MKPRSATILALACLSAVLAAATLGVAAAQGGRLDASMQPIEKKARAARTCVDCAEGDSAGDGQENARFDPEVSAERWDRRWDQRWNDPEGDDGTGGSGALAELPQPDAVPGPNPGGVSPPAGPALPVR